MDIENVEVLSAIASKLTGTANEEELRLIENWLLEDEKNSKILGYLEKTGYTSSFFEEANNSKEKIFNIIEGKIEKKRSERKIRLWKYISIASIVVVILLGGWNFLIPTLQENIYVETRTLYGTTSKIVLSDSTVVELNSGSTLKYPISFKGKERNVVLNGEGYFEVSEDKKCPFTVKTNNVNVRVLGTKFNVKDYDEENRAITTLIEGSISYEKNNKLSQNLTPITLLPNQQVIYDKETNLQELRDVDAPLYTVWRDGSYYFDNETFKQIIFRLERAFDMKITLNSTRLEKKLFSGAFNKDQSIRQILDIFKMHSNFDYEITNNQIVIYDK